MKARRHQTVMLVGAEPALLAPAASFSDGQIIGCADTDCALSLLASQPDLKVDAVLVAEHPIEQGSHPAIAALKACRPELPVILLVAPDSPALPVAALRAGASDYLRVPLAAHRVRRALRLAHAHGSSSDLEPFSEKFGPVASFATIAGDNAGWRAAVAQAALFAPGEAHLLIEGEPGTGKTTVARAIHRASARSGGSLRLIEAAGTSEDALESLLFGHERGAFIGAFQRRAGVLQSTGNLTVVLQDASQLPSRLQQRLAEALSRRRVRPMGTADDCALTARVIVLSSRPLEELVAAGRCDRRLYDVLAPGKVQLPALRQRPDDVAVLARCFLGWFHDQANLPALELTTEAVQALEAYRWPGNARQLQSVLLRAALAARSLRLTARDLPQVIRRPRRAADRPQRPAKGSDPAVVWLQLYTDDGHLRTLADIEADIIRLAVVHCRGRMGEAARQLGMGRSTLYRKMCALEGNRTDR